MKTVLVTGGSGFVALHLVSQLLEKGDRVHATVRSLADEVKLKPLRELQVRHEGRLHLFESDLLKPGSFAAPMKRCEIVYHVASPFRLPEKISDGQREMVDPALLGTRNVIATINDTPSVSRLVFTSTVGAIFGDYIDVMNMKDRVLTEEYFNTSSTVENNPYHYAKVVAEQEAWSLCEAQQRWTMVAINPGLILGPSLTPASESGSLFLLDELMRGYFFYGAADFNFTTVDVRDVALAHIRAAETEEATGRYILAHAEMSSILDMARIIRKVHSKPYLLPNHAVPNWAVRLLGPRFGLSQDYIRKHLSIRFAVDNTRSRRDLGLEYRPLEQTLIDHYRSWASERAS